MKTLKSSRREFLGNLTKAMLAAAVAPQFIPSRVLGAGELSPNNKINLISIGVGGQGGGLLANFLGLSDCRVIGVCDPWNERRQRALQRVQGVYKADCALYNDFEEALANPAADGVVIATPDQWHGAITMAALRAGKAVYCEKPLALSLDQNRAVQQTVKATGGIFQYGTQQRSQGHLRQAIDLVRNGVIGDLKRVDVWSGGSATGGDATEVPVPEGLDWNLYRGPARMRPCAAGLLNNGGSWYSSDCALGFIAGWGAHPLDIAIWGITSDLAGPYTIRGEGTFPAEGLYDTCTTWDVEIAFADGIPMRFFSENYLPKYVDYRPRDEGNGTTFFGTKGWISVGRGTGYASNPGWLKMPIPATMERVYYKPNYYQAYVDSVRNRGRSVGPVGDAVRSDAISHLANMVVKTGQTIVWDPKAYAIKTPEALKPLMHLPTRGPWATV